jgi:hypothetical protein
LNAALTTSIIADSERCMGIAVSNAGGYHSTKDYFRNEGNSEAVSTLSACADEAARLAESHDYAHSVAKTTTTTKSAATAAGVSSLPTGGAGTPNRLRTLAPTSTCDESWVNVNKDGHWNRLHTHVGSTWSGVYYVQSDRASLVRPYSGSLLLKPTSHVLEVAEAAKPLDPVELARLGCAPGGSTASLDPSVCDYVAIKAEPGVFVLFPSWLHHAVTPLSVKPAYQSRNDGLRISMAFNAREI